MICSRPLTVQRQDGGHFLRRCGVCPACALQRAAQWTLRLCLEAEFHGSSYSSFITLTYSEAGIPASGSLYKREPQLFLKRLRKSVASLPTSKRLQLGIEAPTPRYYCVGEYGEQWERPHYHLALFGCGIEAGSLMERAWACPKRGPLGWVDVKPFVPERAAYVARYTQKKSLWPYQPQDGRAREFALMSRKPALGRGALLRVADTIKRRKPELTGSFSGSFPLGDNLESLWATGVPESLRWNGKIYPLGTYLANELAAMLGVQRKAASTPETSVAERLASEGKSSSVLRRQQARKLGYGS